MLHPIAALLAVLLTPAAGPFDESLPRTSGRVAVEGLAHEVTIDRDERGIPVIRGGTLDDVIVTQGFVHAQERFFQMDLLRRHAAGRLAELVGPMAVDLDRGSRPRRFEHVATQVLERAPAPVRRQLELYARGVNAGLDDLAGPPPEHSVLGTAPAPWRPVDTLLVQYAMFDMLNSGSWQERRLGVMHETLPPALVRFLTPAETRFERPLIAGAGDDAPAPVPGPEIVDLRTRGARVLPTDLVATPPIAIGSNNWAISGARSVHGGAILANDPHLRITVPGVWYRAQLEWGSTRAVGITLPGSPGIIIGSNGRVAWGFTNTEGDFQDLVVVEVDPADPDRYRVPGGFEPFGEAVEEIAVRGAAPVVLRLRTTRWGAVTGADRHGRPLVLKWTALDPETVNMDVIRLMTAGSLEEALAIARGWYGPSQNVLLADDDGRIAWVVSGWLPQRRGFDGTVPVSWATPGVGWDGPADESRRPTLVDPASGVLFTANNRTVDPAWAATLGNAWDLGARAQRIGTLLDGPDALGEADLRAIQLDTRVELYDFYRDLILDLVPAGETDSPAGVVRRLVSGWNGRADADQPGMRLLDAYRRSVHRAIVSPIVAPARAADPSFRYWWSRSEEPVRRILETRPPHLLPPGAEDWPAVLRAALDESIELLAAREPAQLELPWGDSNRAAFHHPLSQAAPAFAARLDLPAVPLDGHRYAVRVATPGYGASARLVVSPGREQHGLLHTPAGQSGHPFSPHYRDSHDDWLEGRPGPLLSGRAVSTLTLTPPG